LVDRWGGGRGSGGSGSGGGGGAAEDEDCVVVVEEEDCVVVEEEEWDLTPLDLYHPPRLDFTRIRSGRFDTQVDMTVVAESYESALKEIVR
jgi:hypothetical protein